MLPAPLVKAFALLVGFLVSLAPHVVPGFADEREPEASTRSGGMDARAGDAFTIPHELVADAPPAPDAPPPSDPAPAAGSAPEEPPSNESAPALHKPPPAEVPPPFVARVSDGDLDVQIGGTGFATLFVENRHAWALPVTIDRREITPGWRLSIAEQALEIAAGATAEVPLTLEPPEAVASGAVGRVVLALATPFPPTMRLVTVTAKIAAPEAFHDVSIANSDGAHAVAPGQSVAYAFSVLNLGNVRDTFDLRAADGEAGWTASLERGSVTLAPGEAATVHLTVTAPSGAADEESSWFNVTARSARDRDAEATAPSLTVVDVENPGVPLVDVICLGAPSFVDPTGPIEDDRALFCVDPATLLPAVPAAPEAPDAPAPSGEEPGSGGPGAGSGAPES